jgi:hypothetical protein
MMAKNVMGKSRSAYPGTDPYITLRDERTGWLYFVLKTYQVDGRKPFGRAFCMVEGFAREAGDVYIAELRLATIISWDESVFANGNEAAAALFGKGATL